MSEDFDTKIDQTADVTAEEFEEMAKTPILFDADSLKQIHTDLWELIGFIDDDGIVPERYASSFVGELAEHDVDSIRVCAKVIHRLYLNAKYPTTSSNRYWLPGDMEGEEVS